MNARFLSALWPAGLLVASATLAQDAVFTPSTVWRSGPSTNTQDVAVGDVDLDGDLDFVCVNDDEAPVLYRSLGNDSFFPTQPEILGLPPSGALSVALGDLDNDGDLDLVTGCRCLDAIYWNDDGSFGAPETFGHERETHDVELGDVDGDGDLDVVTANFPPPADVGACPSPIEPGDNVLYFNENGDFDERFVEFEPAKTRSVALGDMDGDGDLDVVCGNDGGDDAIWQNDGAGGLTRSALFGSETNTQSISLGDLDGDGDLDVVCGNEFQESSAYFNEAGSIQDTLGFGCSSGCGTSSVTLGDVDKDGDLDIAVGNDGAPNAVFLNRSGEPGDLFLRTPDWESSDARSTLGLALADFDGDGDLDLLTGNAEEVDAVYRNEAPLFAQAPRYVSSQSYDTEILLAGDLDQDGDVDLVACNDENAEIVYRNEGGSFVPAQVIDARDRVRDAALGDLDGDGYLDLVLANTSRSGNVDDPQPNSVYRNLGGGVFSSSPTWRTPESDRTGSVALGDVNGDGLMDIVFGNGTGISSGQSVLHLNDSVEGMLTFRRADWSPGVAVTEAAALGDLDGDGDLDLVGGHDLHTGHRIYRNDRGVLSDLLERWGSPTQPNDLALGDLDGDGDLDAVTGSNDNLIVYRNDSSADLIRLISLQTVSPLRTSSIDLGDVDADGDHDLVSSGFGGLGAMIPGHDTLRLNRMELRKPHEGPFDDKPAWVSAEASKTQSVALADLDDDGDLDLACGYDKEPNTIYDGVRNPPFTGDLEEAPARHLANNGAFINNVRLVREVDTDTMAVRFAAYDVEADPIWVVSEYQYRGDPDWRATGDRVGPLETSREGVPHEFLWNLEPLALNDMREVTLRLRTVEIPRRVSFAQHLSSYQKEIGPLRPSRPQIALDPESARFDSVSWGDTAMVVLSIANTGNDTLRVSNLSLTSPSVPDDEIVLDPKPPFVPPFEVTPGQTRDLSLLLTPRTATDVAGTLDIESNDPLARIKSVPLNGVIHPLNADVLYPTGSVPLGQDVTIYVVPERGAVVDKGSLIYGTAGTFPDTIPLAREETSFRAVIPRAKITEAGLKYYIEVVNDPVLVAFPAGAPRDSLYVLNVEAPTSMMSFAALDATGALPESLDIRVQAALPQGGVFSSGRLYYRARGFEDWKNVPLDAVSGGIVNGFHVVAEGRIPGSAVGARGVDYWAEIKTSGATLRDPLDAPEESISLPITVSSLAEGSARAGSKYGLFSVPLEVGSVTDNLEDDLGPPDPASWRLFAYDADSTKYVERGAGFADFEPGRGYWLISRGDASVDAGPGTTVDAPFKIVLKPGQNLVGSPYAFPVAWNNVLVNDQPVSQGLVESPRAWNVALGCYEMNVTVLEPFQGYWVKNLKDAPVTLQIPARESRPESRPSLEPQEGWSLVVSAASPLGADCDNQIGARSGASSAWDASDASEPPLTPGASLSLYFPHETWERNPGCYAFDLRSSSDLGAGEWRFDVAIQGANDPVEVLIAVSGIEDLPTGLRAFLVDRDLARTVDLGETREYRYFSGEKGFVREDGARFSLYVGDSVPVGEHPLRTGLLGSYPNPFHESAAIRYELAEPGDVHIEVLDVQGRLVTTLFGSHDAPGRYEALWDGVGSSGRVAPPGVYFYRLTAPGAREVRKMLRIG